LPSKNLGRYEEAIASYDRAVDIKPNYGKALANRGDTYRRLGQHELAIADFNRAIELKPDYTWAIAHRGQTYSQLQHYETALHDLDRALDIDPDYTWAIGFRGELYLWLHRYDKAIEVFNQKLNKNPDNDWTHYLRALALAKTSGVDAVLDAHHPAAANLPERVEPAIADLTQAIQLAQTAREKDPDDWQNTFNLALYYLAAGHSPEAQALYESGLSLAPAWLISMAYRDLRDYLQLFPADNMAQYWCDRLQQAG
jgi:tetratricopeptide (TPR) repeat protein